MSPLRCASATSFEKTFVSAYSCLLYTSPSALAARKYRGQQYSAERIRKYLEGSYIYQPDPRRPLQDPLCYRGAAHINGTLRDAVRYAEEALLTQINSTDDTVSYTHLDVYKRQGAARACISAGERRRNWSGAARRCRA